MEAETQKEENVPGVIEIDASVLSQAEKDGLKDVIAAVDALPSEVHAEQAIPYSSVGIGQKIVVRRPASLRLSESDRCANEEETLP